ncbi:hypothetical protein KMP13_02210 [Epibacterium ulvae]|uniref:hypothetical protein n=1 Tax=Epibacterium ulvae TaxID=1156985 RepID=UPI001BFC8E4A|nr:hypothetical protein [Epibacterium ulvae]MBT8152727.1 hypothetical protein [Epibacterium ulvae]
MSVHDIPLPSKLMSDLLVLDGLVKSATTIHNDYPEDVREDRIYSIHAAIQTLLEGVIRDADALELKLAGAQL